MKAPLSWLKNYVDIDCSVEELKDKLFSCGFEVEEIVYVAKHIEKIVTCKILSIDKHPNADKLSVTKVDAGKYGQLQIVTNAKNIYVGAIVPVAVDGAILNNGSKINAGELRGVQSFGMFCSGEELGINDDWYEGASFDGVLIFNEDFPLGEEVKKLLEIEDVVFDINVTANRPDCQSILGLAREVAAVLDKPLKMPDLTYSVDETISTKKTVKVNDKAFDLCPRYISHYVSDIKIEKSPLWLRRKLFSMGIRSISNIVDITNFVLTEIGQPMHAFDLNDLQGNEIVIRRAENGEKITTLDEKEFSLTNENLVICDTNKPVALAGVMGGLNSGIKDTTKNVVFESATFKRDNIRKTSRALGQRSDSSSRYEKGVDFYSVETGMKRALNLITTLNCGKIACDEYDLYDSFPAEKVIVTTVSKVNEVLGIEVPSKTIEDILKRLTFKVKLDGENLEVTVPLYRDDMESYPDIAEEVIREYGYSNIKPSLLKTSKITNGGLTYQQTKLNAMKDLFVGYGFNEMISYSFVSEKEFELFSLDVDSAIKILNPISEDMAIMRKSLLPSVLRAVANNINRKNNEGRLFEIAKIYNPKSLPLTQLPTEENILSFAVFGEGEDFFSIKGVLEGLFDNFCFDRDIKYLPSNKAFMHPTRSAEIIIEGENVGFIGQVSPIILEKLGVDKPIFACELSYDKLKAYFNDKIVYKQVSKFPTVERDLAILCDDTISCQDIMSVIKENGSEYLDNLSLFDVYQGSQVPEGKKSMAFNLLFLSNERTLNVEEIDQIIKNIIKALRDNLKAELR